MCVHIQKLELLKEYMNWWIRCYPTMKDKDFEWWASQRTPELIEGTPEYYRMIATNCFYCGKEMKPNTATIDHFIPKAKGGSDDTTKNRFVICCNACNNAKAAMKPESFLKKIKIALNTGAQVGIIEQKRLKKVYDNLSKVINEFKMNIKNPVYYCVKRSNKKQALFKRAA